MLSKSKYLRGVKCIKNLWLYTNKKDEQHYSEDNIRVFNRGTSVGELAQAYFPNGKFAVQPGEMPTYDTARLTQEYIQQGADTIYEATFIYDNTIVAVDLLHKEKDGWHLYEVKSTNSAKPEHVNDVAVQYYVLKGCGLELADASVMFFNRSYIKRGDINVHQLFSVESVYHQILPMQNAIEQNVAAFHEMVHGEEPCIEMGKHCDNPYECDFKKYCRALLPPVIEEEKLSLSNEPVVNNNEIKKFLNTLSYPICHLDFETIMPGVPLFDESRPYQQIPFQYSIHFCAEKGSDFEHYAYLAPSNLSIDPRKELIAQMIEQTSAAQSILVYNIAFERSRLREMKRDFPEYAAALDSIIDRLVDLMPPFRSKHYRTESMEGKYSIKKVLPAVCTELSYDVLEISNGSDASNIFLELYYSDDKEFVETTRQHLLNYCELDTLAMVKVLEVLEGVV
jgi:hypothetical protein